MRNKTKIKNREIIRILKIQNSKSIMKIKKFSLGNLEFSAKLKIKNSFLF